MGVTSQIVENPFHGLPFHHPVGGEAKDDFIYNKDSALGIYLATIAEKVSEPRLQYRQRHRSKPERFCRRAAQEDPPALISRSDRA